MHRYTIFIAALFSFQLSLAQPRSYEEAAESLTLYRNQLDTFRREFGTYSMPASPFFLFGMGNRIKLLYKAGVLINTQTNDTVRQWSVAKQLIVPHQYTVVLVTADNKTVSIYEREKGIFVFENGKSTLLKGSSSPVHLPLFKEYRYDLVLRVLLQEILVNIVDHQPLPNYFVYKKAWRRDGAMMAMCLEKSGNLNLIKKWVLSLDDPYDRNNAGEEEADNLGQTLYLLSLFADKRHPLIPAILQQAKRHEVSEGGMRYISGRSDFHSTPVYQTKWMKWGLSLFKLPDPYTIPAKQDDYSALFWWAYKDAYAEGTKDAKYSSVTTNNYPYIDWAVDHFHGRTGSPVSNQDYPLTWEADASQAKYAGMAIIDPIFVTKKISSPHTWHAAEVFLYLVEFKK